MTVAATNEVNTSNNTDDDTIMVECPTGEGCTPGFWKTHPGVWGLTGYAPTDLVGSVFTVGAPYSGDTLLEALNYGGGGGIAGATKILLRASVASLLNSSHPEISFPRTTADVIADVNAATASNDRGTMLALAAELDADNNLGCGIDAHGNPIDPE